MKAGKAENGGMENVKQMFLQSHFLQDDRKGFLKDAEVRLIDEKSGSDPTKPEYYWMRALKTLYPHGLNIVTFLFFRKHLVVSYVNNILDA